MEYARGEHASVSRLEVSEISMCVFWDPNRPSFPRWKGSEPFLTKELVDVDVFSVPRAAPLSTDKNLLSSNGGSPTGLLDANRFTLVKITAPRETTWVE